MPCVSSIDELIAAIREGANKREAICTRFVGYNIHH